MQPGTRAVPASVAKTTSPQPFRCLPACSCPNNALRAGGRQRAQLSTEWALPGVRKFARAQCAGARAADVWRDGERCSLCRGCGICRSLNAAPSRAAVS
jgi:hypothetical protein